MTVDKHLQPFDALPATWAHKFHVPQDGRPETASEKKQ
jgi:hypothetical protein